MAGNPADPIVLATLVVQLSNELKEISFGRAGPGKVGGSRANGSPSSYLSIGHDRPVGQRAKFGCHLPQALTPQFLPFPQAGAFGWK